ncbi:uncharacterized protein LOC132708505 [Cylas formicarius]|uniref:uncharacterized protein LOC132708505 n=1 Tax=Cylas formicarius TaxID=197179 RepID=UPI00295831DC|nr:uncharacterized protein LOC132708505 [Cylas formicarius]
MRIVYIVSLLCAVQGDAQLWNYPRNILSALTRRGKSADSEFISTTLNPVLAADSTNLQQTNVNEQVKSTKEISTTSTAIKTTPVTSSTPLTTIIPTNNNTLASTTFIGTTVTDGSTTYDSTTPDYTATTGEPRESPNSHEFYLSKRDKPEIKISSNISQNLLPLPAGAGAALVKPTKYHYYPHNQHIYLLPECAIQQVCNAVYVRLNWTQPLCACPSRYRDPCSASLNSDDHHTTELMVNKKSKKALTLVKTCELTTEMRICRPPRDWSLLALQNIRTGKSHYLVICRCPDNSILEGPMSHDQPTYASVPGIRVYGMMCVDKRRGRSYRTSGSQKMPQFLWKQAQQLAKSAIWQ